jgi:hypothetical protein
MSLVVVIIPFRPEGRLRPQGHKWPKKGCHEWHELTRTEAQRARRSQ